MHGLGANNPINTLTRSDAICLPAGRYEFKDAGIYIGEWLNEKAVGLGLITKDKCQGEYTGLWDDGKERAGVFLWPNAPGAMYEGEWAHNRRNGCGVFSREDWMIKGNFKDDFIALGMKGKENSVGRFEGEFENGLPCFGVETYADRGSYAGEYKNGIREGLGVRTSIPYGEVINFFPEEAAIAAQMALKAKSRNTPSLGSDKTGKLGHRGSLLSQCSGDAAEVNLNNSMDEEDEPYLGRQHTTAPSAGLKDLRMSTKFRCGFVLSAQRSELVQKRQQKISNSKFPRRSRDSSGRSNEKRARSLTNLFHRSTSRESIARFKRQGSANERLGNMNGQMSSIFTLDQEDAIDPETIETYAGQWEADMRHGYGVCERSDGVMYEGQWLKNQRHGYGQTRFQDGTCEQGRYQYGKLVFLSWSKGTKPHLLLYNYHIKMEVNAALKRARNMADQAREKANKATENLDQVAHVVQNSRQAAELAREYSLETRELVKEMYPDFEQPGIKYLEDMVLLMKVTKCGNHAFESALQAAEEVLANVAANQAEEQAAGELGHSNLNLDVVKTDVKSVSRAESYRMKRRSRNKKHAVSKKSPTAAIKPEFFLPPLDVSGEVYFPDEPTEPPDDLTPNAQPITLVVPQITNYVPEDEMEVIPNGAADLGECPEYPIEPKTFEYNTEYWMNGLTNSLDQINVLENELAEKQELHREPSVETTYIIIPNVTHLQPESRIPTIPLNKLITNPTLMNDHFDHYGSPQSQRADFKPPPPIFYTPITTKFDLELPPQPKLGRRRTLPVFLTHKPVVVGDKTVSPKYRFNQKNKLSNGLSSKSTNQLSSIGVSQSMNKEKAEVPLGTQILDRIVSYDPLQQDGDEGSIYLVDEGKRKRIHPHTKYQPDLPQNSEQDLKDRTKSPMLDGVDGLENTTQMATRKPHQPLLPTVGKDHRPIPLVSNVLMEDFQDEIPELPTSFSESLLDFRLTGPRYSVPDLAFTKPAGLTENELTELSRTTIEKRREELRRRQQGEIIIQLIDLLDWCARNMLVIAVLVINGTLAYLFARLAHEDIEDE